MLCCIVLGAWWSSVSSASAVVARFFLRPQREIHSLVVLHCITSTMIICFFSLSCRCSIFSSATARNSQSGCIVLRARWSSVSSTSSVVARFFLRPQRKIQSGCAALYYEHDDHLFLQPQQSLLDFFFGHSAKFSLVVLCCITSMMIICFFSLSSRCLIFSSATARNSQGS